MKKYYSVKEAAKLMGVSTNTVYAYLDSGKIIAKRIGRGRFKIPYNYLKDYIDNDLESSEIPSSENVAGSDQPGNAPQVMQQKTVIVPLSETPRETLVQPLKYSAPAELPEVASAAVNDQGTEETHILLPVAQDASQVIIPMVNDKIFWRLFKGIAFLGMGIIYLFTGGSAFKPVNGYLSEISNILNVLLPYGLLISGVLNLADAFFEEKVKYYDSLIHILNAVVLTYFSFLSLASGDYGRFVFTGAFTVIIVSHLVKEIRHEGTLFDSLTKFGAVLSIFGGVALVLSPPLMPIPLLSPFVEGYRSLFGFLWVVFITVPFVYLISEYGKKSTIFASTFYLILGGATLIIATESVTQGKWDIAFLSYLLGVYGIFIACWKNSNVLLDKRKFNMAGAAFVWVGAAILVGILVQHINYSSYNQEVVDLAKGQFSESVNQLKNKVDEYKGVLTSVAGSPDTVRTIESKDEEKNIEVARKVFDKTDMAVRVLVMDADGKALGVYPRQSIAQGTNFSSRQYFIDTKALNKGVISDVYVNILGKHAVSVTEPVFKDNQFFGMISIALDLEKISGTVDGAMVSGTKMHVLDSKGNYIFGANKDAVGKNRSELAFLQEAKPDTVSKDILISQNTQDPAWTYVLEIPKDLTSKNKINYSTIILTVFILINSSLSIFAGLSIAMRRRPGIGAVNTEAELLDAKSLKLGGAIS